MTKKTSATLLLIFSYFYSYSQIRSIQILSEDEVNPIDNVEVYDGENLIGKSDLNGFVKINFSKINSIYLIKDGYKDKYLNKDLLETKIFLTINKPIELNEVIVRNLKIDEILDSIKNNLKQKNDKYCIPDSFKMSNILRTNKDTLHYVNSYFKYDKKKGFQIKENSKIIKNFTQNIDNNNEILIYKIKNKQIEFWEYLTVSYIKINGQLEFSKIINNRDKYNFEILSDSIYYKINIKSKKTGKMSFNGYIIVDKLDFGIYEFKLNLSGSKNNDVKITSREKIKQSYDILEIDYFIKYIKDDNENYNLVYSFFNQSFIQKEGNFKNIKFSKTSTVENSFNFNNENYLPFDIFNYNIK
jgi:hypothetical protein